ncbi:MAG: DoxX family protein [Luteolibacter sp.]
MKKFFFDCGTRDATASLGFLALRLMVGLMMVIGHGIPKIQEFSARKTLFYVPDLFPFSLMSPTISLSLCIGAEVLAASFIIIGLATRPAAFVLGISMVVAAFGFLGTAPWFVKPPTITDAKELSLMYLIPLISIILAGAGNFSLDSLIYKDSKRRRW